MTPTWKGLEAPPRLTPVTIGGALWTSAIDAFVKTILMLVMGSIALGLLGGIFSAMAPSLPPFLAGHANSEAHFNSFSTLHQWWSAAQEHEFAIVYLIMFVLCARVRLAPILPSLAGDATISETRLQKIGLQLSKNWFRLIVTNAFNALISAMVLYFVENFTGTKLLLNLLLATVLPAISTMATFVFGSAIVNFISGTLAWYGDNQLRFNFWIFYLAAVCDDLGIPNLKTLARFLWSRWRSRNRSVLF
jgi:hypothetical protein